MNYSALIGNPVEHSVSPLMYEYLAKKVGVEYKHLKIKLRPDELNQAVRALRSLHFSGCNVTIPYKESIGRFLSSIEESSKSCGAINTIFLKENELVGANTDWVGVSTPIKLRLDEIDDSNQVLVLGTGGAARAAIYALKHLGYKNIVVCYRLPKSSRTLRLESEASVMGINLVDYEKIADVIPESKIVCNMTSAGMTGADNAPFNIDLISGDLTNTIFMDAVFSPIYTPLLTKFKDQGAEVIDGLWMMIFQGIESFRLWTNKSIETNSKELVYLHNLLAKEVSSVQISR
jgi:shikimate dehydrogenase